MTEKRIIGFIGVGVMGNPIGKHLLERGHELVVYDPNTAAVAAMQAAGARGVDQTPATALRQGTPFQQEMVTITKQEHIELVMQANQWKSLHQRALVRIVWLQARNQRQLELTALAEASLRCELEHQKALVRDLQKRLFARKSERHQTNERQTKAGVSKAHRGQQDGKRGHGRILLSHLPGRDETIGLNNACCPDCGKPFDAFPGTEDSEVLEIEVKAYRVT